MGGCINKSKNVIIKKSNKPIIQNQNHFSKIKRKSRISTFKTKEFKQIDLSFHTCYSVDITNEIKDMIWISKVMKITIVKHLKLFWNIFN